MGFMKAFAALSFASLLVAACSSTPIASSGDGGAGATGAAGTTGAAGATGVAGTTGTAGATETAGTTGTAGTGGQSGKAGSSGDGGKGGKAGSSGDAGKTGTDGGASDAGDVCAALQAEYAAAIAAGQKCNLALNRLTCQLKVNSSLRCPGCTVSVDDDKPAMAVQAKWAESGCAKKIAICPAIACINPGRGLCDANPADPGSIYGTCKSGGLTPVGPAP
jgi:hypothetical protein